jgi:hypothetical protein
MNNMPIHRFSSRHCQAKEQVTDCETCGDDCYMFPMNSSCSSILIVNDQKYSHEIHIHH